MNLKFSYWKLYPHPPWGLTCWQQIFRLLWLSNYEPTSHCVCLCVYVSVYLYVCLHMSRHTCRVMPSIGFNFFSLRTQHSKLKGRSVGLLDLKESQTYFKGYYLFQKKKGPRNLSKILCFHACYARQFAFFWSCTLFCPMSTLEKQVPSSLGESLSRSVSFCTINATSPTFTKSSMHWLSKSGLAIDRKGTPAVLPSQEKGRSK